MKDLHVLDGRAYGDEITVRHLLSHTSGSPTIGRAPASSIWSPGIRRDDGSPRNNRVREGQLPSPLHARHGVPLLRHGVQPARTCHGERVGQVADRALTGTPTRSSRDEPHLPARLRSGSTQHPRPSSGRAVLEDVECGLWTSVMMADWAGGGLVSTTEDLDRFLRAFLRNKVFRSPRPETRCWPGSSPGHEQLRPRDLARALQPLRKPRHAGLGEIWGHSGSSTTSCTTGRRRTSPSSAR